MNKRLSNILVVRSDRIGDVVLTIPALRALKTSYPLARITVWATQTTRSLLEGLSCVDEVIYEASGSGWRGYLQLIRDIRRRAFDAAVVFHTKKKTNAACFLAGVPVRLGYHNDKFGFLLSDSVIDERQLGLKHEAQYCLDLLRLIDVQSDDLTLELPRDDAAAQWSRDLLRKINPDDHPLVLIHPDASCPSRRWPVESYAALARDLVHHCRARVLVVGADTARTMASEIVRDLPGRAFDLAGQTSLLQMAALARRCSIFLSCDSGPVHVAAAVGAPVAVIFMRNQPGINWERWRPLGSNVITFRNRPGEEIVLAADGQVSAGNFHSITPEDIFIKVAPLLVNMPDER